VRLYQSALTGARILWLRLCTRRDAARLFGNHGSHGDFRLSGRACRHICAIEGATRCGRRLLVQRRAPKYVALHLINAVLIDRDPATRTADPIRQMADAIGNGDSLIVFPEGTRNTTRRRRCCRSEQDLSPGACLPGREFVPVWIENSRRVMPKGQLLPVPLLCTLSVGAPIKLRADEDKDAFIERTRGAARADARRIADHTATNDGALRRHRRGPPLSHRLSAYALKTFVARGPAARRDRQPQRASRHGG
jgi:hypothetical protein